MRHGLAPARNRWTRKNTKVLSGAPEARLNPVEIVPSASSSLDLKSYRREDRVQVFAGAEIA